jgi:hypothetical protein
MKCPQMDKDPTFDPFSNRCARDIRNSLSDAFVDAMQQDDFGIVEKAVRRWLAKDIPAGHADYIRSRKQTYRRAFREVRQHRLTDPLARAVVIWNLGLFFELHDLLEVVWQRSTGDARKAVQGLIKAAGVYIHLEYDRGPAARRLAAKAVVLLRKHRRFFRYIEGITDLLECLDRNPLPAPKLEFADGFGEAPRSVHGDGL